MNLGFAVAICALGLVLMLLGLIVARSTMKVDSTEDVARRNKAGLHRLLTSIELTELGPAIDRDTLRQQLRLRARAYLFIVPSYAVIAALAVVEPWALLPVIPFGVALTLAGAVASRTGLGAAIAAIIATPAAVVGLLSLAVIRLAQNDFGESVLASVVASVLVLAAQAAWPAVRPRLGDGTSSSTPPKRP